MMRSWRAFADLVDAVMAAHVKADARAVDLGAFGLDGDGQAGRRRRDVAEHRHGCRGCPRRHRDAVRAAATQRPFHQPDHEAGREHRRHGLELGDFADRDAAPSCSSGTVKVEAVLQAGLERWLHGSPFPSRLAGLLVARQHVVRAFPGRQEIEIAEFLRQLAPARRRRASARRRSAPRQSRSAGNPCAADGPRSRSR